jgi:hypothetical protein
MVRYTGKEITVKKKKLCQIHISLETRRIACMLFMEATWGNEEAGEVKGKHRPEPFLWSP